MRGNRLSYSEISTAMTCLAKWKYRYVDELPSDKNGSMVFGTAVHKALSAGFQYRFRQKQNLELAEIRRVFRNNLIANLPGTVLGEDENQLLMETVGEQLLTEYFKQIGYGLKPVLIEEKVEKVIRGVPILGFIDLAVVKQKQLVIVDFKTVGRQPADITDDQRLQLTIYRMLCPDETLWKPAPAEIHYLNRTKIEVSVKETEITAADYQYAETIITGTAQQMMSGPYVPNRQHNLCTKRWCSYWQQCVADHGGLVRD